MQYFFDAVRRDLFSGGLKQSQVDGLNVLLDATAHLPIAQRAYVLATAFHETAKTMQPIAEYGKGKGLDYGTWRVNSKNEKYCPKMRGGAVYAFAECPHLFYGRGFVQLTWYANYEKAGRSLGVDLIANPDAAMGLDLAARILVQGMVEGWFTGKKLGDYFSGGLKDYVNARRIVNGTDKANAIAVYARAFEAALGGA